MNSASPRSHARDDQFAAVAVPTGRTIGLRTFIPWQLVRFLVINLRMLRIISRGHHR